MIYPAKPAKGMLETCVEHYSEDSEADVYDFHSAMWQRAPEEALDPKIDARNITNTDTAKENSPSKTAAEASETVKNTVVVKTLEPEENGAVRGWKMLAFGPLAVGVVVWTMV